MAFDFALWSENIFASAIGLAHPDDLLAASSLIEPVDPLAEFVAWLDEIEAEIGRTDNQFNADSTNNRADGPASEPPSDKA